MRYIADAIHRIHAMDFLATRDNPLTRLHPLAKTIVTVGYIILLTSFDRYNLTGVLSMALYLMVTYNIAEISLWKSLRRFWLMIPVLLALGIANLWFDHVIVGYIGKIAVTGGMITIVTLLLKGAFALLASYIFMATTTIEQVCAALRLIHVPKVIVTLILLIYRYMIVLMKEVERIITAYEMRAPEHKGVHFSVWGTLAGQLLLRSIDRAQEVYESMIMRGYDGDFKLPMGYLSIQRGVVYAIVWSGLFLILRFIPLFEVIGRLITKI